MFIYLFMCQSDTGHSHLCKRFCLRHYWCLTSGSSRLLLSSSKPWWPEQDWRADHTLVFTALERCCAPNILQLASLWLHLFYCPCYSPSVGTGSILYVCFSETHQILSGVCVCVCQSEWTSATIRKACSFCSLDLRESLLQQNRLFVMSQRAPTLRSVTYTWWSLCLRIPQTMWVTQQSLSFCRKIKASMLCWRLQTEG